MNLNKYSFGIGDRFGQQGKAQLKAIIEANKAFGLEISPVWNKSNREHQTVGTEPEDVRKEADEAVKAAGFALPYFVDADHINLSNVEKYIPYADFFTIDVADYIGEKPAAQDLNDFIEAEKTMVGDLKIPGIDNPFKVTEEKIRQIGEEFLYAIKEAKKVYDLIISKKDDCIVELSMDEVDEPQTPLEMLFILKMAASNDIPIQTIAPKFSGNFFKGVDYEGDISLFEREFEEDLLVIDYAIQTFGMPENLKLSVHSGSDKFSIYPIIGRLTKKHNKGVHIKTAGTTWLEEAIGLALSGNEGLSMVKTFYQKGYEKIDELSAPYASVIDIKKELLPEPSEVNQWTGEQFANTLRHIPGHKDYNPNFRQLVHISYKLAAADLEQYIQALHQNESIVNQQVFENIYDRHLKRLFGQF